MITVHGNSRGLFHPRPAAATTEAAARERLQQLVVDRHMAERREEACHDRLVRRVRQTPPVRYRVGHAISGLGDRIAGAAPAERAA